MVLNTLLQGHISKFRTEIVYQDVPWYIIHSFKQEQGIQETHRVADCVILMVIWKNF